MELEDLEKRAAERHEVNWVTAIFMMLFHVGAVAALITVQTNFTIAFATFVLVIAGIV